MNDNHITKNIKVLPRPQGIFRNRVATHFLLTEICRGSRVDITNVVTVDASFCDLIRKMKDLFEYQPFIKRLSKIYHWLKEYFSPSRK